LSNILLSEASFALIKEDGIGGACSTHEREIRKASKILFANPEGKGPPRRHIRR